MITFETVLYIVFACVSGVAQLVTLLLNEEAKDKVWKRGLYAGMVCSGYAAIGFMIPWANPVPCLTYFFGSAVMLCCVVLSYYLKPVPAGFTTKQIEDFNANRNNAVRWGAIGLAFTLSLATIAGFMEGQQDGQRVQAGFAGVVYRLANEVESLHDAVNRLTTKVTVLERKTDRSASRDSVAQKQVLRNQEEVKATLKKRR